MTRGFNRPLYILPFDHRGSFQTGLFGWKPPLSDAGKATRDEAAARIAGRYREFVDLFEET